MDLSRREFLGAGVACCVAPRLLGGAERDVSWLREAQRIPAPLPKEAPSLPPLLVDAAGAPIRTLAAWQRRRGEIRKRWLEFLGEIQVERRPPLLTVVEEDRPAGCRRQLVRYEAEPGIAVEGYLLRPEESAGKRPGVVVLHSTVPYTIRQPAGLEGPPEKFFGLRLAQKGMVAFCPRCFLWEGEGGYLELVARFQQRHPGIKGMSKMLFDAQRALDVLETLPEVDARRLGAVGHSLGAKEVLYLAAFDERVQAAVSSEGGIGMRFSNWEAPWYLGPDAKAPDFPFEHHELLALAAPRPFLLIGGESADGDRGWPFLERALPVYRLFGAPPRLAFFNHRKGHSVPPEAEQRLYEWLGTYLSVG